MSKTQRKTIDTVFILLGTAMTGVLIAAGGLSLYGYHFATNSVRTELAQQKVFFPPKGSAAITSLPEADQKEINKYAGQQLLDGQDPTNAKLQGQKATLFQGETLRGLLLGSGYAYWTFGMIAKFAALAAFAGAGVMAVLVWLGLVHLSKLKK
jgi:hypothetical protein